MRFRLGARQSDRRGNPCCPASAGPTSPERKLWEAGAKLNRPSYLPSGGGWLVGVSRTLTGPRRDAAIDFAAF